MGDLPGRAIDINHANFRLGNEVFQAAGATFVRNAATPSIYDANHVSNIVARKPAEIDHLLEVTDREFQHSKHRRFLADFRTPPEFVARLLLDGGYERSDALVSVLDGEIVGSANPCDIRMLESDEQWEAFSHIMWADWVEIHERMKKPAEEPIARQMLESKRSKQPPVQYWLAYVNDEPVGYFNSWEGIDGLGQVEDLFVLPAHRKGGIATALVHHCAADARAKGAGPLVIVADPTDTPKNIYARMGFRPVAVTSAYHKVVEQAS